MLFHQQLLLTLILTMQVRK